MKRNRLNELKLEAKAQGLHLQKGGIAYGSRSWTLFKGKSELAECTDLDSIKQVIDWQRENKIKQSPR